MKSFGKFLSLPVMATLLSGVIFTAFLAFRMGWYPLQNRISSPDVAVTESETWMGIYQNAQKIGVSNRKITPSAEGAFFSETTVMRLNTMGMVQDIHLRTQGSVNPDLSLSSFQSQINSGSFRFSVSGKVQGTSLVLDANGQPLTLLLQSPIHLSIFMWDAAARAGLTENQSLTLSLFDPLTLTPKPVRITALAMDKIEIMGAWHTARKTSVEIMGSRQFAWIADDGSVLQEEGLMGITLRKISKKEAEAQTLTAGEDLTRLVSVPADQKIADPEKLNRLVLGITGAEIAGSERQHADGGVLTLVKEDLSLVSEKFYSEPAIFLASTALIQSDHPAIIEQLWQIISESDAPLIRIRKITEWVFRNIEKRPVLSVSNALETLENRMGDCNEHAVLLAAFARASGIPARIETGLVYLRGRFYYHAWNSVFLGKWITVDSLMNQIPADVTHISLARGNPESQLDILGVIGNIGISILEQQ